MTSLLNAANIGTHQHRQIATTGFRAIQHGELLIQAQ
jgi:hypothetical protein